MELQKILVPVDFSEFSDKALESALMFASRFGASLTLAHVSTLFQEDSDEESRFMGYKDYVAKKETQIQKSLKERFNAVIKSQIKVDYTLLRGVSTADTLLSFLEEMGFDLVIMGTHGRTGLRHMMQGSVSEKVVRMSPVPVLTIHRSITNHNIKRILVPLDFSQYSQYALEYAADLAELFKAKIIVMHVIEQEVYPTFYDFNVQMPHGFDPSLPAIVHRNLREFVEDYVQEELVEDYIVLQGPAHREIVEYVKLQQIDLLIIASHGLTGLEYLLLGSTAEKVIRWATCPVLTIKRRT